MKFIKIFFYNLLVLFFTFVFIEIIFGYWFDKDNLGPYMREHRMKKIFTPLNTTIKLMTMFINEIIMVLEEKR